MNEWKEGRREGEGKSGKSRNKRREQVDKQIRMISGREDGHVKRCKYQCKEAGEAE